MNACVVPVSSCNHTQRSSRLDYMSPFPSVHAFISYVYTCLLLTMLVLYFVEHVCTYVYAVALDKEQTLGCGIGP